MNEDCSIVGIPEYLHQRDRIEDQDFSNMDEELFRRFREDIPSGQLKNKKHLSHKLFELKEDSYNRGKFCNCKEDVLYNVNAKQVKDHFLNWGILLLLVKDFNSIDPIIINGNPERIFSFGIKHDPIPCNYSHSIHIIYCNGEVFKGSKPKSIKTVLRDYLVESAKVLKEFDKTNELI